MRHRILTFCLTLLLNMVFISGVSSPACAQIPDAESRTAIIELLSQNRDAEHVLLQQLYQQRQFSPLWIHAGTATQPALDTLALLRNAASYGLRAADYDATTLTYRLAQLATLPAAQSVQRQGQLDVAISTAVLRFINHVHFGRIDPRKAGFDLQIDRSHEINQIATLTNLSISHDIPAEIAKLEPQFAHYRLLKAALARYQLLAMDDALTQLPRFAPKAIKPGELYEGAVALRRLLVTEKDLSGSEMPDDSNTSLDPALVKGLQNYQARHGLPADGVLGKQTFAELATPFARRVEQIELTLERWRWMPPLQSPMIVVNIPQFKLFALKATDDQEANLLQLDVIVGQTFEHTQTPVFLADMKYVVFRPYWDVPLSITQREILPNIRRNPDYLQHNHFQLVRGQGDNSPVVTASAENIAQLSSGKVRVRQLPGSDNALGDIKFMLPNRYNVYLHSTPAKQLFSQTRRAFSHGCIRVSEPMALAEYVLRNTSESWSEERIQAAMQGAANQRVYLNRPIPVMIVYGTVMPLESGVVQFFADIYGHDARLAKLV